MNEVGSYDETEASIAAESTHSQGPRGWIDGVENGVLVGWFWNGLNEEESIVELLIDGANEGYVRANLYREDLEYAKIGAGKHSFRFVIPARFRTGEPHEFILKLQGDADTVYATRTLVVEALRHSLEGRIERISDGFVFGWACDLSRPESKLRLSIKDMHGATLGSGIANLRRQDLIAAGIGDGCCGFKFPLSTAKDTTGELALVAEAEIYNNHVLMKIAFEQEASSAQCPATAKLRPFGGNGFYLHAKHQSDLSSFHIEEYSDKLALTLDHPPQGWVRILHKFPGVRELISKNWDIKLGVKAKTPFNFMAKIMDYHDFGQFRNVLIINNHVAASEGWTEFKFAIKAKHLRIESLDEIPRPTFIVIETETVLEIEDIKLSAQSSEITDELIPYRNSEHYVCVRLAQINDALPFYSRHHRDHWVLEMVDMMVRLECFETASSLINQVQLTSKADDDLKQKYLWLFAEIAFAEGRMDELRALLLEHKDIVLTDDCLFSAFSLCFPSDGGLADFFGTLPSGLPNRSFLSKCGLSSTGLRAVLASKRDYEDGQTELLAASIMRPLGAECYLHHWNRYLTRFGLANITKVDLSKSNILPTVRFEKTAASEEGDLVTVIMSAYNAAETIRYSAASILDQTYRNVELLICDDCSTDETVAVMKLLAQHPSVRIFQSIQNQGTYNIRNALLQHARGRLVTFQDSDDLSHPERIARQVHSLQSRQSLASMARWVRVRPNGDVVFFRDHKCLRLSVVSIMAERSVYARFNDFRNVQCGADSDVYEHLRMIGGRQAFAEVDMPLILGLWSAQSMTQQNGLEATEDGFRSASRRAYAEVAARHRLLGPDLVSSEEVDDANKASGIFRRSYGVRVIQP